MAFRLVWFWRYELLWPRGFSRRGRRGGHAHAASPQRCGVGHRVCRNALRTGCATRSALWRSAR